MKLILSRKGFDSGYGEIPSIILPTNEMVSFPISDNTLNISYYDVMSCNGNSIGDIIDELSNGVIKYENKKLK